MPCSGCSALDGVNPNLKKQEHTNLKSIEQCDFVRNGYKKKKSGLQNFQNRLLFLYQKSLIGIIKGT